MAGEKHVQGPICYYGLPEGPPFNFVTTGSDLQLEPTTATNGAIILFCNFT